MSKMITFNCSDGVYFKVEEAVALEFHAFKDVIVNDCFADAPIPLFNVTSKILPKVIKYCKRHVDAAAKPDSGKAADEDLKTFDQDFFNVDQATLFDLIMAANYLSIESLHDRACQEVANMIKGKRPEHIRKILNIKNDFTPKEEEKVYREVAFEGDTFTR